MKAMILAAGRGKRLRPLTDQTPKPLLKIDQFAIIEHLLFKLGRSDFKEIVINVAYLAEHVMSTLSDGSKYGVNISYSVEDSNEGLETGGGIFNALPLLGEDPFLVVSGDIWTDYPFSKLKKKKLNGLAHLILVDNPADHPQGDFYFSSEKIDPLQGIRLTFGNIGIYHPTLFEECSPGFFPIAPILRQAVMRGEVTAEHFQGEWQNIGTPEALYVLRDTLLASSRG